MADLQGPKIRVGKFKDGKIHLNAGDPFTLDATVTMGDQSRVGLDYKELPRDVKAGDVLLLDDGKLVLDVVRWTAPRFAPSRVMAARSPTTRASTARAAASRRPR